ncbi:hypothetical protein D3C85_1938320 [compost metagenome]
MQSLEQVVRALQLPANLQQLNVLQQQHGFDRQATVPARRSHRTAVELPGLLQPTIDQRQFDEGNLGQ